MREKWLKHSNNKAGAARQITPLFHAIAPGYRTLWHGTVALDRDWPVGNSPWRHARSRDLEQPRLSPRFRARIVGTRARGIPPRMSHPSGAVSHSFEQRNLQFVRVAFEFHVHPPRFGTIFASVFPPPSLFLSRTICIPIVREVITATRSDSQFWRGFAKVNGKMKLDVSDVLYDSSSVSSDSGTSQSSRVSHDFLSSIANVAVLPNNVSSIDRAWNVYMHVFFLSSFALMRNAMLLDCHEHNARLRRVEFQSIEVSHRG